MAEYIDKEEVLKIIDNVPSDLSYWAVTDGIIVIKPDAFDRMHNEIDSITKADVVEVVRCKDCIYFQGCNFFDLPVYYCMLHKEHDDYEFFTEHNNYCSFGVRKDLEN